MQRICSHSAPAERPGLFFLFRSNVTVGRCFCLALLIVFASCGREAAKPAAAEPPVILISIDTLRSDRLPAYGYQRGSTPNIDRFRSEAILYRHAFSHCPQTLPSHASIFTGLLPPMHGVRDNIGYRLRPSVPTLASRLKQSGYQTGAAVSSYVLRRATGLDAGFDSFEDTFEAVEGRRITTLERDGENTRAVLEQWLAKASSPKIFAFLHLYEPHAPYAAPRDFRRVADDYDNEVAYADDVVGRFFQTLRARGLYEQALIILLSDHGEGLGDHGEDEHGVFLYRESIQVPLLIKLPGGARAGQSVDQPVGLAAVFDTVLGMVSGNDRAGLLAPKSEEIYSESYYSRLHFGWSELRSIVSGSLHFIDAPERELYDYVADPGERHNIADAQRRVLFALSEKARKTDGGFQAPSHIDPEDQRKLAALGYISSGGAETQADPKTKVETLRDLRRAFLLSDTGRHVEAVRLLESLTAREPGMAGGWWLLGRSRGALGDHDAAIEAYRKGLSRFPGDTTLALGVAEEYAAMQRWDLANRHAELALERDPVIAHEMLSRIAARQKQWHIAEKHGRAALAVAPDRTTTLFLMADIMVRSNRLQEGLSFLDRARDQVVSRNLPRPEALEFRRGEALLALGRIADAERAFRAETEAFPRNRQAWASLALVVGGQGRRVEAGSILKDAIRRNNDPAMRRLALEAAQVMSDEQLVAELRRR